MKVLVTGGFGYVGGRLARHLLDRGHETVLASRTAAKVSIPQVAARTFVIDWDSSESLGRACRGVDAVVHAAGMNATDSASDPAGALAFNALATAHLLSAAIENGVERFIYLSTAHVYGSPTEGTISEATCPFPIHPYATSHRAGEDVVRAAHHRELIQGVVVRLSNAFGPPVNPAVKCWSLVVNDLCRQGTTRGEIKLRSSGTHRRDFVTLTDTCSALEHLLTVPEATLGNGVFNVGGEWSPTIIEVAERVAARIAGRMGRSTPAIRCSVGGEEGGALDYRIDKLLRTGFIAEAGIDRELDALVDFCAMHFAAPE